MRSMVRGLTAAVFALSTFACSAQDGAAQFTEGKDYKQVKEVQQPADPKRIEVAEFFWYGCPHCYAFDPTIESWAKTRAGDVDFVRIPNTLGRKEGEMHARAFYTAEVLNVGEQMHLPLFDTIQKDRVPLNTEDQIQFEFNKVTGVLPDVFHSTFTGFTVDSRVRKAQQLAMSYGITSVPTIVVGGKYLTSAAMVGGFDQTKQAIDFLVDKVRKERAAH